jgi:hypothetical protein
MSGGPLAVLAVAQEGKPLVEFVLVAGEAP